MGRRKKSTKPVERSRNKCEQVKNSSNDSTNGGEKKCKNSTIPKLLDIYGRLELPLLKLDENNILTDSDDEETLEFEIRPRFVFSCSMCLVCMSTSEPELLCEKCKMVSYCKMEHLNENRSSHGPLCEVMCQEFGGADGFSAAKDASPEIYRLFRIKLIDMVETKIRRPLDLWEREIILYPRVCRTCRKIGPDLTRCEDCTLDFYCHDHASEHAKWCKDFQVYRRILRMQHVHGYARPNFPDITRKSCYLVESLNFDKLLLDMFDYNVNYRRIDAHTYASMSLSATAPLTALFALQKTLDDWMSRESLKIHVVGAEFQFECSSLRVWEKLFIHFLPKLKNLELEFTGPELRLPGAPIELLSRVVPCRRCKNDKRCIVVRFNEGKLYHEISESAGAATPPADLICLFNPGLYRETGYDGNDTWPKTIQRFCRAKVPVVVTSYTEIEIPRDIQRIQSIAKVEIILEPQKNPFASIKPDRNFVSDDIVPLMYKNYCLSVVKGL